MHPEFPPEFLAEDPLQQVSTLHTYACSMLRLGMPCGNNTNTLYVSSDQGGRICAVAICDGCLDESDMSGAETTAYWRRKQKEWRVR